jgi:hypothetical protein
VFDEDAPSDINALRTYFQDRQQDASRVLELSGLVSNKRCYEGVHALLDNGYQPRQLQVLVDALPVVHEHLHNIAYLIQVHSTPIPGSHPAVGPGNTFSEHLCRKAHPH